MPEQLPLSSAQVSLSGAEADFKTAIVRFYSASTPEEQEGAANELDRTRGILIMEHGLTLEQICELVDRAE